MHAIYLAHLIILALRGEYKVVALQQFVICLYLSEISGCELHVSEVTQSMLAIQPFCKGGEQCATFLW
jgi:hypothetical protein